MDHSSGFLTLNGHFVTSDFYQLINNYCLSDLSILPPTSGQCPSNFTIDKLAEQDRIAYDFSLISMKTSPYTKVQGNSMRCESRSELVSTSPQIEYPSPSTSMSPYSNYMPNSTRTNIDQVSSIGCAGPLLTPSLWKDILIKNVLKVIRKIVMK